MGSVQWFHFDKDEPNRETIDLLSIGGALEVGEEVDDTVRIVAKYQSGDRPAGLPTIELRSDFILDRNQAAALRDWLTRWLDAPPLYSGRCCDD